MNKKHEKSSCQHRHLRRFGPRRRQCRDCGQTRTLWPRQSGRPRLRTTVKPATAFINHCRLPIRKDRQTRNRNQYRLARSRQKLASYPITPQLPGNEPLILIADALVKYVSGGWQTWYFTFVRRPQEEFAVILSPYRRSGRESGQGWVEAIERLGRPIKHRIVALVSDGQQGLVGLARQRSWVNQRCHFHLLATLQSQRSRWPQSRHREEARILYQTVKLALITKRTTVLKQTLADIELLKDLTRSRIVRLTLSGFLRYHQDYRTYLTRPELRLPTTTNSAEAFISLVEELSRRARGFRTVTALDEWIRALIKVRQTIKCTPENQQD